MRKSLIFCVFILFGPVAGYHPASADCTGTDLLAEMAEPDRTALLDRAAQAPYPEGLFWTAKKDDQVITLVGTFHLNDPRLAPIVQKLTPLIQSARTVMVEAGPEQERDLRAAFKTRPELLILQDTSLPQLLSETDWQALSKAMQSRGMPAAMAAKFQPWYISALLGLPDCLDLAKLQKNGLDAQIIRIAQSAGVPIAPLEPFDTVFRLFESISRAEQIEMVLASLAADARADDFFTTMTALYFAGKLRVIWELYQTLQMGTGGQSDQAIESAARLETLLITGRNESWILPLETAAARGPVLAAFGALHLPGDRGVVNLLAQRGWQVAALPLLSP